jgi:hypothetical protein
VTGNGRSKAYSVRLASRTATRTAFGTPSQWACFRQACPWSAFQCC